MSAEPRVRVPRLVSRSGSTWVAVAAAVVAVVGVVGWGFATQPLPGALAGAVGLGLVVLLVAALASRGHALDTERGELVRTVLLRFTRRIPWAGAEVATLHNRGGVVVLQVRTPGSTATYLPLAAADLGGERSQDPGFLRVLADEVERWGGHTEVAAELRAQADHVAAGGAVLESPLARRHLPHAR